VQKLPETSEQAVRDKTAVLQTFNQADKNVRISPQLLFFILWTYLFALIRLVVGKRQKWFVLDKNRIFAQVVDSAIAKLKQDPVSADSVMNDTVKSPGPCSSSYRREILLKFQPIR